MQRPMILAAARGDTEGVRQLLARGADPDSAEWSTGPPPSLWQFCRSLFVRHTTLHPQRTALIAASQWPGHPATVQLLLEHGANPAVRDAAGEQALSKAMNGLCVGDPAITALWCSSFLSRPGTRC